MVGMAQTSVPQLSWVGLAQSPEARKVGPSRSDTHLSCKEEGNCSSVACVQHKGPLSHHVPVGPLLLHNLPHTNTRDTSVHSDGRCAVTAVLKEQTFFFPVLDEVVQRLNKQSSTCHSTLVQQVSFVLE